MVYIWETTISTAYVVSKPWEIAILGVPLLAEIHKISPGLAEYHEAIIQRALDISLAAPDLKNIKQRVIFLGVWGIRSLHKNKTHKILAQNKHKTCKRRTFAI